MIVKFQYDAISFRYCKEFYCEKYYLNQDLNMKLFCLSGCLFQFDY